MLGDTIDEVSLFKKLKGGVDKMGELKSKVRDKLYDEPCEFRSVGYTLNQAT